MTLNCRAGFTSTPANGEVKLITKSRLKIFWRMGLRILRTPTSLSTASGSRRAVYSFKEDRGLLSSDQKAGFVLDHEGLIVLNQDAPVIGL